MAAGMGLGTCVILGWGVAMHVSKWAGVRIRRLGLCRLFLTVTWAKSLSLHSSSEKWGK